MAKPTPKSNKKRERQWKLVALPFKHWIKIFGMGVAIVLGAYKVTPCSPYLDAVLAFGFLLIIGSSVAWVHNKGTILKLIVASTSAIFVLFAGNLLRQAYIDTHAGEYIALYDQYRYHWNKKDEGEYIPHSPILINPGTVLISKVTHRAIFTPIVDPVKTALIPGTHIFMTIYHGDASVKFNGPFTLWRPLDPTDNSQTYWTTLDFLISPPGLGPNEMLSMTLPQGKYDMEYFIKGFTGRGCGFSRGGVFSIEIP